MAPIPTTSSPRPSLFSTLSALRRPNAASLTPLARRQQQVYVIPTSYDGQHTDPPPGTIVGIVLGTVCGVLLILYLVWQCLNMGGARVKQPVVVENVIRTRRHSRRGGASSVISHSEMADVRSPPPPRRSRGGGSGRTVERTTERIIVDARSPSRSRVPSIVDHHDEDIVEVFEEHSPSPSPSPPARRSRRASGGYRNVDPEAFAGGGRPMRKVGRR